jgi:hypothetical protein
MTIRLQAWAKRLLVGTALAWNACAASLLTPVEALAQSDDAIIEIARERFQEGVRHYDKKQYEKARASFLQAYALKRHPAVLLNLAQSELRSGHEADAAQHFELYLREHKEASALERQEAEKGLTAAKARVGQLDLSVDVAGADISVDGQSEGVSPLPAPLYLEPGKRTIEARKGTQHASTQVEAVAGRQTSATLNLASGGAAPTPASGTDPSSSEGTGPAGGSDESSPEQDSGEQGFELDTSAPREPFFDWFMHNEIAWIGGGVTVLGIVGGVTFALTAKNNFDAANSVAAQIRAEADRREAAGTPVSDPCGAPPDDSFFLACQKFKENEDAANTQKTLSIVSWIVAGVAAGGTVAYYFIDTPKKAESVSAPPGRLRVALVPVTSPTLQGVSLAGEF